MGIGPGTPEAGGTYESRTGAPHEAGFVCRGLTALVRTVCRFPRTVLALSAVLCVLSLYGAFFHLEYHTQRSDLISPRKECQQRWRNYLQEFGDDDDIVAVVRGSDRGRMIAALEQTADRVRRRPDLFDRLFYKADLRSLHDRALLMLPKEEIEKIKHNLDGDMSALLTNGDPKSIVYQMFPSLYPWRRLTLLSLLIKGKNSLPDARPLDADEVQFYTELRAVSRAAGAYLDDPSQYRNPWGSLMSTRPAGQEDLLAEPQYFFSGSGGLAFLLVRPKKEQGSFTAALKSVEAMRGVVAEARTSFPDLEFGLTGMPVLDTDEMAAAQRDTQWASWLAVAGVAVLFLVVYRGVAYPTLTLVTLLVGTAWALGWLTLTVGHLNILSATFAVMLIGMGDYGVLWVMRYEQARRQGMDVRSALLHTTTHVAVGNLTAAMTLALAFYAAVLADFQAVAELGWIAGCGVLLCAFACFTVLPSLLMLFDRRQLVLFPSSPVLRLFPSGRAGQGTRDKGQGTGNDSWLPFLARRPWWVVAGGATLLAALGFCASRVSYDHNLLHLQAQDLESVRWEMTLIRETAGASWHALSIADSPEKALELKAKYEKLPEVSRVVEVATLAPPDQDQKLPLLADIQDRLRFLPERNKTIEHDPPVIHVLRDELTAFLQELSEAPPSSRESDRALLGDLRQALQGLLDRLPASDDATASPLQGFEEKLAGDLSEDLHRLREVSTPQADSARRPAARAARALRQPARQMAAARVRQGLSVGLRPAGALHRGGAEGGPGGDRQTVRHRGRPQGDERRSATSGIVRFSGDRGGAVLRFPQSASHADRAGAAGDGRDADARHPRPVRRAAEPGQHDRFPAHPGGRRGQRRSRPARLLDPARRRADPTISYAIGRGVMVKALTSMIGFGTLMISSERGLAGLGLILTLGVGCSMLSALVFLPAVLHLLGGRRKSAVEAPATAVEAIRQAA